MVGLEEGDRSFLMKSVSIWGLCSSSANKPSLEGYTSIYLKGKAPWAVCLSQELLEITLLGKIVSKSVDPVKKAFVLNFKVFLSFKVFL